MKHPQYIIAIIMVCICAVLTAIGIYIYSDSGPSDIKPHAWETLTHAWETLPETEASVLTEGATNTEQIQTDPIVFTTETFLENITESLDTSEIASAEATDQETAMINTSLETIADSTSKETATPASASTTTVISESPETVSHTTITNTTTYSNITEIPNTTEISNTTIESSFPSSEYVVEEKSYLEMHFIDVGQGDSTLIICNNEAMLIDAGDNSKGTTVQLYLKKHGIEKLKYLICTHPDSDHIGGADVIITKYDIDTIIMPDVSADSKTYTEMMDAIRYRYYSITYPSVGDTYSLGSASFTIIGPAMHYGDDNNNSVSILLTHGSNRFLLAGDTETEAEYNIANSGFDIHADLYKVSHHGSNSSTSDYFLNSVNPKYAVISCGKNNAYGHPTLETLYKLNSKGIEIYRTDEQSSIIAVSDGSQITFNVAAINSLT